MSNEKKIPSLDKSRAAIDRIGTDALESALASDDLLLRRDEIIAAPVKERE